MAINYYAYGGPYGGSDGDMKGGLHIGNKAPGCRFLFRAHPSLKLTSLRTWVVYLSMPTVKIRDEWGKDIALDEMLYEMTVRFDRDNNELRNFSSRRNRRDWYERDGQDFCTTYF